MKQSFVRWSSTSRGTGQICRRIHAYKEFDRAGLRKKRYPQSSLIFKCEVVSSVLGKIVSCEAAALKYGVSVSAVECRVRQVKLHGYESLQVTKPRGRPPKIMGRPKRREPQTELGKLRARNEWLEAENALLKRVKALVEKQDAQQRKPSED